MYALTKNLLAKEEMDHVVVVTHYILGRDFFCIRVTREVETRLEIYLIKQKANHGGHLTNCSSCLARAGFLLHMRSFQAIIIDTSSP